MKKNYMEDEEDVNVFDEVKDIFECGILIVIVAMLILSFSGALL